MAKEYGIKFGVGALSVTSGLAPTFIHFVRLDTGGTVTPPGITQIIAGIGIYKFSWTPSYPIFFEIDGATTGLGGDRYMHGILDRIDQVDQDVATANASLGSSMLGASGILLPLAGISSQIAIVQNRIGDTTSSYGTDSVDPVTIYGYVKRLLEFGEGAQVYTKATGVFALSSRGSTTLLRSLTTTESSTEVTRA